MTLSHDKSCDCPLRHWASCNDITSLHRNHPGLLTAMMTAPDLSHRDPAFTLLISEGGNEAKGVKVLSNRLNAEHIPTKQWLLSTHPHSFDHK